MTIEERLSQARTEMQEMFTETEVPPAGGVRRRNNRRNAIRYGGGALAIGLLAVGGVIVFDNDESDSPLIADNATTTVVAVVDDVTARIELDATTVVAGESITGEVVFVNNTDQPIELVETGGCTPMWNVVLHNDEVDPDIGSIEPCGSDPITLPPGETRLDVTVQTEVSCATESIDPSIPICPADGGPALLPPGEYETMLVWRSPRDEGDYPDVPPVPVTVTAPSSGEPSGVTEVSLGALLGATADGRVVVVNEDGSVGEEIVRLPEGTQAGDLQVIGDDVWFISLGDDETCGALMRMPLAGGSAETIVEQTNGFAVSPDGGRVSYTEHLSCPDPGPEQAALITKDLATGATHRWTAPSPEETDDFFAIGAAIGDIAWASDGSRLAVQWCYEGCSIQLHDANVDGTLSYEGSTFAESPTFVNGTLYASMSYYGPDEPAPLTLWRYDTLDAEPVEIESPFSEWPNEMYAGSGGSLLAIVSSPDNSTGEGTFVLERWDGTSPDVQTVTVDPAIRAVATKEG